MVTPVILCGGTGSRLWPASREQHPKQFLVLEDKLNLLQATLERVRDKDIFTDPIIMCSDAHLIQIILSLEEIGVSPLRIILEPEAKNTAAAVALAALYLESIGQADTKILVLPSDNIIKDIQEFNELVKANEKNMSGESLLLFGIEPRYAATGYGYIRSRVRDKTSLMEVESFVEKPPIEEALRLIEQGNCYWNSGMFMFTSKAILSELKLQVPELLDTVLAAYVQAKVSKQFIKLDNEKFCMCPNISIDKAVMEKSSNLVMVAVRGGWSDIGSWDAIYEVSAKDSDQNVIKGDVVSHKTKNCYLESNDRLAVVLGLDNIILVATRDAILLTNKEHAQEVKLITERLHDANRREVRESDIVYRAWGYFQTIEEKPNFKVKRLLINRNAKISLQFHKHRSEHWVVLSGEALITRGKEEYVLAAGASTYIPKGEVHRIENIGQEPLQIIEVQLGDYLGEDDIVRLDDMYGRCANSNNFGE